MKIFIGVLLLLLSLGSYANPVQFATDLYADSIDSAAESRPLVVLYTASYCIYCEAVKTEFFNHIASNPEYQSRIILREVVIDGDMTLTDFSGTPTNHAKYGAERNVKLVPTVSFYDSHGNDLVEPLVGVRLMDFYMWYLNQRIEDAVNAYPVKSVKQDS